MAFHNLACLFYLFFALAFEARAESLFDRLIRQNNGQIPIPFTKLTDMIVERAQERVSGDGEGAVVVEKVLVPEGRSVQKNRANAANPRVLYAIDTPDGKIFLGYAKDARQIEVISWNQSSQSFDFQVVQNYSQGGRPNVHTAPQGACTSCHQNNGPIFPKTPWSEMENQALIDEMRRATGGNSYEGVDLPPVLADTPADRFDRMVVGANGDLQRGTMCQQVCGQGNDQAYRRCRRNLLLLAVNGDTARQSQADFGAISADQAPTARDLELIQGAQTELQATLSRTWPSHNFSFPDPMLPDRDPVRERTTPPTADERRRLDPLTPRASVGASSAQDFLSFVRDNQIGLLQCLGLDRRDLRALSGFSARDLDRAMATPAIDALLGQRPPNRDAITAQILRFLSPPNNSARLNAYCADFVSRRQVVGGPTLERMDETSQQLGNRVYPEQDLFVKYCQRCHTSDSNPLPFNDLEAMKKYGEGSPDDMIQTRLQRHFSPQGDGPAEMPPEGTTPTPTDQERRAMIRALNRFSADR